MQNDHQSQTEKPKNRRIIAKVSSRLTEEKLKEALDMLSMTEDTFLSVTKNPQNGKNKYKQFSESRALLGSVELLKQTAD